MDAETLKKIVLDQMMEYAGEGLNGTAYQMVNEGQRMYAIVDLGVFNQKPFAGLDLLIRLIGSYVVIESDANNKPLVDALLQAGVPRGQIVLTYAGEILPTETSLSLSS